MKEKDVKKMDTKEIIEFVKKLRDIIHEGEKSRIKGKEYDYFEHLCFQDCVWDEVIPTLQQGEACRAICKAIKEIFKHNHLSYVDMDLFNELERKYSPKSTESLKELSELMEIDYEGAWKELKGRYRKRIIKHEGQELQENILWQDIYTENMNNIFRDIERKHTNAQRRIK